MVNMTTGITKGRLVDLMERKMSPTSTLWNAKYKKAQLIKTPNQNFRFIVCFFLSKKILRPA